MEDYTLKIDELKTTQQTISLISALYSCFYVCSISSAAVFVDSIWGFWIEALHS